MSYGIPCPDDGPNPEAAFQLVSGADQSLAQFVGALEQQLTTLLFAAQAGINQSIGTLADWVKSRLTATNKLIGKVWDALQAEFSAANFAGTVSLSTSIADIATTLQTTQEDVINGPALPSPLSPAVPPFAIPSAPSAPSAPVGIYPPGYPIGMPTGNNGTPNPPQPRPTVVVNGTAVTVTPLCYPVTLREPININNVEYDPTFTAYYTGAPLKTSDDQTPMLPISYDVQADGSMIVNVGPISIHMRLPATKPGEPDATCDIPA